MYISLLERILYFPWRGDAKCKKIAQHNPVSFIYPPQPLSLSSCRLLDFVWNTSKQTHTLSFSLWLLCLCSLPLLFSLPLTHTYTCSTSLERDICKTQNKSALFVVSKVYLFHLDRATRLASVNVTAYYLSQTQNSEELLLGEAFGLTASCQASQVPLTVWTQPTTWLDNL